MPEPSILDLIVEQRRKDVSDAQRSVPAAQLERALDSAPPVLDFAKRLEAAGPMAIIGEIKRASPSKGDIAPGADAAKTARTYASAGAAGISVLTEPTWFKGSLDDLAAAREVCSEHGENRPGLLRKDFIVDEYQVTEARAVGADSILLIVACLTDRELEALMAASRGLGMEPFVEVNNDIEMKRALGAGAALIGINNRDLRSFSVDMETTGRLAAAVPSTVLLAGFSGVRSRADIDRFAAAGARAALVGEALMLAPDPAAKVRELLGTSVPS